MALGSPHKQHLTSAHTTVSLKCPQTLHKWQPTLTHVVAPAKQPQVCCKWGPALAHIVALQPVPSASSSPEKAASLGSHFISYQVAPSLA